ncbi:MAG TPA: alkaline shock response membrane anchor protein AmaP [Candidatus Atribacteria bacterium]|nr:alkaline shock response membrane anchor protein AmaP [Candidatus Atribacteria bacterium]
MSKKSFNNLIFILFLVIIFFVSGIIFSLSLGLFSLENVFLKVNYMIYSNFLNQVILTLVSALLIAMAIYLIWRKGQYDREDLTVSQKTSFGEVKISLNSVKQLILKVLKEIREIKEVRPEINLQKTGEIKIDLHTCVKQDVNIPELSERVQRKLKDYLLETSGIELKEIKIHIDKIFYEDK